MARIMRRWLVTTERKSLRLSLGRVFRATPGRKRNNCWYDLDEGVTRANVAQMHRWDVVVAYQAIERQVLGLTYVPIQSPLGLLPREALPATSGPPCTSLAAILA